MIINLNLIAPLDQIDADEQFTEQELNNQDYAQEEEEDNLKTKLVKTTDRRLHNSKLMLSKREATNETSADNSDDAIMNQDDVEDNSTEITTIVNGNQSNYDYDFDTTNIFLYTF